MVEATADPRVSRFRSGDESALAELYDEFANLVYSLALRVLGDPTEAEDVLQETWIQAWRDRGRYRPEQASFHGWITMIARSRALDRLRRRATRTRKEDEVRQEGTSTTTAPIGDAVLMADRLRDELESLDPRHRQALELAYWGGLSHAKISEEMGQPLGTVKTWVRTGLLALRDRVVKEGTS